MRQNFSDPRRELLGNGRKEGFGRFFFANVGTKKSHIIFVLEKCFKQIMKFPNAALGRVHDY